MSRVALIDAGNSRLKWVLCGGGRLRPVAAAEGHGKEAIAELTSALPPPADLDGIWLSHVLGASFERGLCEALGRAGYGPPSVASVPTGGCGHGVRVAYNSPSQLGVDRFLAMVAARQHDCHCLVVDCGTAVTIDALSGDGGHLGGVILPGPALMQRSLLGAAHGVRRASDGPADVFATDTAAGVSAGTWHGVAAAIDRIGDQLASHWSEPPWRLITGGDAGRLLPLLGRDYQPCPDLVLRGLAVVAGC